MSVDLDDAIVDAMDKVRIGISRAHKQNKSYSINPKCVVVPDTNTVTQCPEEVQKYYLTAIELDLAITTTDASNSEVGGGLTFGVINFGAKGGALEESVSCSRMKISIPILTPAIIINPD